MSHNKVDIANERKKFLARVLKPISHERANEIMDERLREVVQPEVWNRLNNSFNTKDKK